MLNTAPDAPRAWSFWIDRGGTFTDVVARAPDGRLHVRKLLSDNPAQYADAVEEGLRSLLDVAPGQALPAARLAALRFGTTLATNALLERSGEPPALLITRGFGDALAIGYQDRPRLFDLAIERAAPLYSCVVEVRERIAADGSVLEPLDEAQLRRQLARLRATGNRSLAIVLLHSCRQPAHEQRVAQIAVACGFDQVVQSHAVMAVAKLVPRGDTAVADAYLQPVLDRYLRRLRDAFDAELAPGQLLCMRSDGSLVGWQGFRGSNAVLSGPAAGALATKAVACRAGRGRCVGFDMGGTSTDVSIYDGRFERELETVVAGVRLCTPMLPVHTVAAGGSSVLHCRDGRLQVGPDSAGADPGPACYRNGGPLCLSDANLLLGHAVAAHFPAVFGPDADCGPDRDLARVGFEQLVRERGEGRSATELAAGFVAVAEARMARAVRQVLLERGHDPRAWSLCCLGSAAGQHAAAVAELLDIDEVLCHPLAGVLSAWGMGLAELRDERVATVQEVLDAACLARLRERAKASERELEQALCRRHDAPPEQWSRRWLLRCAYGGADGELELQWDGVDGADALVAEFERRHQLRFGYREAGSPVTVVLLSVQLLLPGADDLATVPTLSTPSSTESAPLFVDGVWREVPLLRRAALGAGFVADGPLLLAGALDMVVVRADWSLAVEVNGLCCLRRRRRRAAPRRQTGRDPALLEIFNHRFMGIAEQMGAALRSTARSVNIRERLDFSCALFDRDGALIANAPHIPVHLGSMGGAVRAVAERCAGQLSTGTAFAINDPYLGGTHLPDITVVMPVHDRRGQLVCYTAARGHHADIGGITPGSMPADSRNIGEEGVCLRGEPLLVDGCFDRAGLRALLGSGPWPARDPEQNLADLRAQLAACHQGARESLRVFDEYGAGTVLRYIEYLFDSSAAQLRRALTQLRGGSFRAPLDNGAEIAVRVTLAEGGVVLDFSASSGQCPDNFNAPLPVCRAAALYVLRSLIGGELPLNDGCLRPLTLVVPPGCLLNPRPPAAVVAGNVETSQVVVDALYAALGIMAASQGTMNNLSFGDDSCQYYETVCGGTGAGADFDGASAVHSHMTNSRITDPELLESRYPVRLERFSLRRGSGGAGRRVGGDGVVRELRFLRALTASVLGGRRRHAPFGLAGGSPGAAGRNFLWRADGRLYIIPFRASLQLAPGDLLRVETPGGGGFGAARETAADRGDGG